VYKAHKWKKGELITAEKLNNMEEGAVEAVAALENARSEIEQATADILETIPDDYAQLDTSVSTLQAANVRYSSRFSNALIGHATGTGSVSVDDAAEATIPALEVAGNSEQVVTTGAQLLDMTQAKGGTNSGITITTNKDGSYTYSGTATDSNINVWLLGDFFDQAPPLFTLKAGTYYKSGVLLYNVKNCVSPSSDGAFTLAEDTVITGVRALQLEEGKTYDGVTVYPMLNAGSTPLLWEPYTGGKPAPSPDYPQAISGTGTVGTGAQLLNANSSFTINNITVALKDCIATISGTVKITDPNSRPNLRIDITSLLESGRTYCASTDNDIILSDFYVTDALGNTSYPGKTYSVTGQEQSINLRIIYNRNSSDLVDGETINVKAKIMLNVGSIPNHWEPYTGGKPSPSEEYPQVINVRAHGEQLFDVDDGITAIQHDDDGWITVNIDNTLGTETKYVSYNAKPSKLIKPQTNYLVVCEAKDVHGVLNARIVSDDQNNPSQFSTEFSVNGVVNGYYQNVCTAKNDFGAATYMLRTILNVPAGTQATAKIRLSVLEDTSITQDTFVYQPYRAATIPIQLTAPLHGIGDVRDRIICKGGEWGIERQIVPLILDGSEDWFQFESSKSFGTAKFDNLIKRGRAIMCDGLKVEAADWVWDGKGDNLISTASNGTKYLRVFINSTATVDTVKALFAARPVMVMAVRATPTWEPFPAATQSALNALSTYPGYTYITVDAGGPAAEISLDYVQDIQAAMAAQHQKIKAEMDEQLAYILSLLPADVQAAMIDTETNNLLTESEDLL